jgi:hypothetical protein
MLCFDEDMASNLEVQCQSLSGISGCLVAFLSGGNLSSEFLVEFI